MENLKEPEKRSCAVCARVLHAAQIGRETHWVHADLGYDEDHPPVPVGQDEMETQFRCDFCFKADPPWVLPTRAFESGEQRLGDGSLVDTMAGENFAACDECARLIRAGRWNSVINRVMRAVHERHGFPITGDLGRAVRDQLNEFYAQVRQNITGPLRPRE
jgi:hypothetical protein